MVVGDDPVATRLVASFAHRGGNDTGVFYQTAQGDAKRLQVLSEAIPGARRFGYLGMSCRKTMDYGARFDAPAWATAATPQS
jgi:hypothetical protein